MLSIRLKQVVVNIIFVPNMIFGNTNQSSLMKKPDLDDYDATDPTIVNWTSNVHANVYAAIFGLIDEYVPRNQPHLMTPHWFLFTISGRKRFTLSGDFRIMGTMI